MLSDEWCIAFSLPRQNIKMLPPHGEAREGPTVNLHVEEMQDFWNRTVVKVGNNGLFPGQIVRGIGAPLTYLIFAISFWISP